MAATAYSSSATYAANDRFSFATPGGTTANVKVTAIGEWFTSYVVGEVESYSDGSSVKPDGCDTADIVIANGTYVRVWNACNRGATAAGTTSASYGNYYQFGTSTTTWTNGTAANNWDWKAPGVTGN